MKYSSGGAFRIALEQLLRTQSLQTGMPLIRLRKMVVFDRFLARLLFVQPDAWVVKGGLALQLRLGNRARTTKDIDVLAFSQAAEITLRLREAGALDLGDWFSFEVTELEQHSIPDQAGIRHPIHSLLDGRTFEQFHIDVGVGDPLIGAIEYFYTPALLDFAELNPTRVPCYPITQQIAEKLHAYTRPRKSGESSRVKDFVDILLLSELGSISGIQLLRAIQATFTFMGTHAVPAFVPPPPPKWENGFRKMAKDVGIENLTIGKAYAFVQGFLDPILKGDNPGLWDPATKLWGRE